MAPTEFWRATASSPAEPSEQISVGDALRAFRKGIEATIPADDHEARFNLGLAFFEMGLLDESIEEFRIAAADSGRSAECLGMIGLCFRARGDESEAIQAFSSAIKTPGTTDFQKAAFFFELAVSLDATGERHKAAKMYRRSGFLLRSVAAYRTVLGLGVASLIAGAHSGLADLCDELKTKEGESHRRAARETQAVPPIVVDCSFCGSPSDFARPPARSESSTICAECLFEARDLFAWTPTA